MYAPAQPLDFLARTKKCLFPEQKPRGAWSSHPGLPDGHWLAEIQAQQSGGIASEDFFSRSGRQGQICNGLHIALDVRHSGPIAAKDHFIGVAPKIRKIFKKLRGGQSCYFHIHILMKPRHEKGPVVPKPPARMGHNKLEIGKIHLYVVEVQRIAVFEAAATENG